MGHKNIICTYSFISSPQVRTLLYFIILLQLFLLIFLYNLEWIKLKCHKCIFTILKVWFILKLHVFLLWWFMMVWKINQLFKQIEYNSFTSKVCTSMILILPCHFIYRSTVWGWRTCINNYKAILMKHNIF